MILFITDACLDQWWNLSVSFGFKFLENKVLSQDGPLFTDFVIFSWNWPLVQYRYFYWHAFNMIGPMNFWIFPPSGGSQCFIPFWIVESKCGLATSPQPQFVTLSMSPFPGLLFAHLKSHFLRFLLIFGKSKLPLRGLGTPFLRT